MAGNSSEQLVTLEDLNALETDKRTSAIVYLSVVMSLGIPGNLLVIIVYFGSLKRRQGTHWMFIRALAITDFLVCTLAIPFELFQQTHQLTFYSELGCKFFRAMSNHLSLMSSLLLVAMSANRLRRVCQPLKSQLTPRLTGVTIGSVVAVGVFFCWPEAALSGISAEKIKRYNLTGYDCSFSDRFVGTDYTTIYSTILLTVYLSCMLALVIMYSIVGRQVLKRSKYLKSKSRTGCVVDTSQNCTELTSCPNKSEDTFDDKNSTDNDNNASISVTQTSNAICNELTKSKGKNRKYKTKSKGKTSKNVTRVAFAVSFCFILSYLPYVAVKLNASVVKGQFVQTPLTKAIFPILARTFVLNNIINPVIYGFLDSTFLQHCKMTLRLLFCLNRKDFGVRK